MLKALAVMLLTAAHNASANDEAIADEFDYLDNNNEANGISSE